MGTRGERREIHLIESIIHLLIAQFCVWTEHGHLNQIVDLFELNISPECGSVNSKSSRFYQIKRMAYLEWELN